MAIDRAKVNKNAQAYLSSGKVEKAIDEFRKLVDDNPKDYNTLNTIGDLYIQLNRVGEGVEIHKRLGMAYERDGFHARAAAIMQKVCRNAPDDIDAAQRLADLYRQMNKVNDAVKVHMQVAEHFTKKGLIKRALEEFTKVVDLDPKNLKMKARLADLYNKEGMKDRAAAIYLEVAEALALEQKHQEANQILERAKTMVTTPQVFLTQSRLCVIQGDLAGAAAHLREGLNSNTRSPELLEALAEIEIRAGNSDRAIEALGQIAQLPERNLPLCEKALRSLAQNGRADEGLRLFQPIARELARRGAGDAVTKTIRTGLQNNLSIEVWTLLAEIAHQSGRRDEQINALQHAHSLAEQNRDATLMASLKTQLAQLGAQPGPVTMATPPAPVASPSLGGTVMPESGEGTQTGYTEVDPLKRMKVEQLAKEAEALLRTGSGDRAIEAYKKALEIDPANVPLIDAIAEIHRKSGFLGKAQMQYMQSGEQLLKIGKKNQALHVLDKAESLFPNSTRLLRRMNGLPDFNPNASKTIAAPAMLNPPPQAAIPMPAPAAMAPPPPPPAPAPPAFDALIPLDLPGETYTPLPPAPAPAAADFGLPPLLEPEGLTMPGFEMPPTAPLPPAPATALSGDALGMPPDLDWMDATDIVQPPPIEEAAPAPTGGLMPISARPDFQMTGLPTAPPAFELPPLPPVVEPPTAPPVFELPPLSKPITAGPVVPKPIPMPVLPEADAYPGLAEELEGTLGDIDFQLDYGSPEEAKIEIQTALKSFPEHPELLSRLERAETALKKLGHLEKVDAGDDFENSFFDLTDVLGTALMDGGEGEEMHDATKVVEKVQSVEELFGAFRQGVEQQVKSDDYDTHYNLGIAYKEMMLIDPAIDEFKIAMGDPERTLECCSMLAICEQARGDLDRGVQWLLEGIHAPGFPPEDSIGLRYDLAEMYLQMGNNAAALEEFRIVAEMDPEYRDVAARLA
jgi:pilus assembly protein FimV